MPGFTHMIDGAMVRILTLAFYHNFKYIPQTIHDAFLLNPVHFFDLYKTVTKLYKNELGYDLKNLIEKCFIMPSMENVPIDRKKKITSLIEKFDEAKGDFTLDDIDFSKIMRMYCPEG